jgi:hypothetical protein
VVAEEKLQVSVEAVEFSVLGKLLNLFEEDFIFGIQAAGIEDAFLFGGDVRQSHPENLCCF